MNEMGFGSPDVPASGKPERRHRVRDWVTADRLAGRLLALVLAVSAPLVVLAGFLIALLWHEQREAYQWRYLERVRALALAIDTEVDASVRLLNTLTHVVQWPPSSPEVFGSRTQSLFAGEVTWQALSVSRLDGSELRSATRTGTLESVPIDPTVLHRLATGDGPVASNLLQLSDGSFAVQIGVRGQDATGTRYVVAATIDQGAWLRFMSTYKVGPGATITLLDGQGRVIARTLHNQRWVGYYADPQVLRQMAHAAEGVYSSQGLEGQPYYGAYARIPRWGWYVATGVPTDEIGAALRQTSLVAAGCATLALAAAIGLAIAFARRVQAPIHQLAQRARQLGGAQATSPPPRYPIEEVAKVGAAMEAAGQELNEALLREKQARAQAEAANLAKDQFLAMLGHELRNPLNAIVTATQVIKTKGSEDPIIRRCIDVQTRQSRHLAELLDDLLDVARVTTGKIALSIAPVNLSDLVQRAANSLREGGRLEGHVLAIEAPEPAWVNGDATRLEQVLVNLLENAVKYTPVPGKIHVTVRKTETRIPAAAGDARDAGDAGHAPAGAAGGGGTLVEAVVTVEDNGPGVPTELGQRVFELFTQGEQNRDRSQGGLGLGLTLVKRLVELHGGHVELGRSRELGGALLRVSLPLLGQEPPPCPPDRITALPPDLTVVLVEDDVDSRTALAELLSGAGRRVYTSSNGPEGEALIRTLRPDVAVLDIGLGGKDGLEVARSLRADGLGLVLIGLSGYGQDQDHRAARAAGFDDYLVKPLDAPRLYASINRVLAHRLV